MRRIIEWIALAICLIILGWLIVSLFDVNMNNTNGKSPHLWNAFNIFEYCFEDGQTAKATSQKKISLSKEKLKAEGVKVPDKHYTRANVELLAKLIMAENGHAKHDSTLYLTGAVVLKRVKSSGYPNTVRSVIYQKGQYSTASRLESVTPSTRALEVANELLIYGVDNLPDNLVFQSMFPQGKKTYKKIDGEYFCLA